MKGIILAVMVGLAFLFGACTKAQEPRVVPQYEITTVSPGVIQVTAYSEDRMSTLGVTFTRNDAEILGYGRALAGALSQISQQYEIKHVIPITYSVWPGTTSAFGITKALIVIVEPKN